MASIVNSTRHRKNELIEIAPGFWNVRSRFKILTKMVDIETQMSIIRLRNGSFLVVDTVELNDSLKNQINHLTDNGDLIEGVIGTHPFHTQSFLAFYQAYPQAAYYGTPRHLRRLPEIPWLGSLNDYNVRQKWESDVKMRIPAGAELVNPQPESSNHFISVFVFHRPSRTLHVDGTIMYTDKLAFLLRLFGHKHGAMIFHPSIKGPGLHPTAEAPYLFRDWMLNILRDWPFENICCAHMSVKIGGAHAKVVELVDKAEPLFAKLSKKNQKKNPEGELPVGYQLNTDVTGNEFR